MPTQNKRGDPVTKRSNKIGAFFCLNLLLARKIQAGKIPCLPVKLTQLSKSSAYLCVGRLSLNPHFYPSVVLTKDGLFAFLFQRSQGGRGGFREREKKESPLPARS
ncbi:hypothetical protein KKD19_01880 [Patescibacteria group bacterium]|nr:hypothetical protein [Patescibacteria group bacterium]MBU4511978.1 hypothetical protein [Patescibacteria group bacterium]MCG2693382.1 hypothetical protein [Candidatus Parcubacteria bacterium]